MARLSVRHLLLAVLTVAPVAVIAAPPARAAGELRVSVDGNGPLVNLAGLIPGGTRESNFSVANTSGDDAALALRLVDLREDDNGCVGAEAADGDSTCGAGGGELGRDLMVAVVPLGDEGQPTGPAVAGSVRDLVAWTAVAPRLAAGTERSFRLDWALPGQSGNDVQTDTVSFDVEFVLEQTVGGGDGAVPGPAGPTPDVQVLGAQLEPAGPPTRVPGTHLPKTGADPVSTVEFGSIALGIGAILLVATRRRRRPGS